MTPGDLTAMDYLERHVERLAPLVRASNHAGWVAATTGSNDAVQKSAEARTALRRLYADPDDQAQARRLLASATDPLIRRQLVLLDHQFTANQLSAETLADLAFRESELEQIFYNFRSRWEDTPLSNNELREKLETETDSARRRGIWEASKEIGPLIAPKLLDLVRRRNESARGLGFSDFYAMELTLQEIDEDQLFDLLGQFRERTDGPFRALRDELDSTLSVRFAVPVEALRPWHWDDFFGQEAPKSESLGLDRHFADLDQEAFVRDYFARIGLPVDDILRVSDLWEREGKDQGAFCTDIDRMGDVRILCNLRPDERWMRILLHELGHAVYDKYIPRSLPFVLRAPAHTMSTEAIAMFFGRLTRDGEWLRRNVAPTLDAESERLVGEQQRLSMMVSARWILVMVYFERELYRRGEEADLNRLWWDLVESIQLVKRPDDRDAPDWATKLHLSLAPVYYHNYLLGELTASQISASLGPETTSSPELGDFLGDRLFARGASLHWNDLLEEATGEPLSTRFFIDQFVTQEARG